MRNLQNISKLLEVKPNFLGFIFYPKSPRYVGADWDETIAQSIPHSVKKIGVFVNESADKILSLASKYKLDGIQLHGSESPEVCKQIRDENLLVLKAFSVDESFDFELVKSYELHCDYFLFDTKGKLPGGNGITFDWNVLENYHFNVPYFLSGGIGTTEIDGIKEFLKSPAAKKCYAIDVNSRFEKKPGTKNKIKLQKFKKLLYEN